jgi:putative hemolysin
MRSLIPLGMFLLGCAAIYVGTVQAAFSALMRLPLRLTASRNGADDELARCLERPVLLFVPAGLLLGLIVVFFCTLLGMLVGASTPHALAVLIVAAFAFVVVCEYLVPHLIVRANPQMVLEFLLPSFRVLAGLLLPLTLAVLGLSRQRERDLGGRDETSATVESAVRSASVETGERRDEGDERRMLQSIVDFGDILVREIMTPRPDIVAIRADASLDELRALFREQQYSRIPVYHENLDNIVGIVFVKDLLLIDGPAGPGGPGGPGGHAITPTRPMQPVSVSSMSPVASARAPLPHSAPAPVSSLSGLLRPATFVPETKRVPELLKEFQSRQIQAAIAVDEYGGTAGLVTIEDMLEEIVGEIRDEYDVEAEPIIDEGHGVFVFSAKVDIDEVADRLDVEIEREGFDTVGGFVISQLGRVPAVGERVPIDEIEVEVLEADRRRLHKVRMWKIEAALTKGRDARTPQAP